MKDSDCVQFLQWALPRLQMRWPGFRKVRRQVYKRIRLRISELSLPDFAAYRQFLEVNEDEWPALDRCCRISISRFYRDRGVFDYLRDEILPSLAEGARNRGDKLVRCWSAGCASGEEVYTVNIIWNLAVQPTYSDISLKIIGTDCQPHMLRRTRLSCYPASSLKDFPSKWVPSAFTLRNGTYCLRPEFQDGIELQLQDIRTEMPDGPFDLILCRHLAFTYFDQSLQNSILRRITDRLTNDGVFVTGIHEAPPRFSPFINCKRHKGIFRRQLKTPRASRD